MNPIEWIDALQLDHEPMDRMHRPFIELLAAADRARDDELAGAWGALVDHMAALFELENRWMRETRPDGAANHQLQHRVVLNLLRDGTAMARSGQHAAVRELARELAAWFVRHTQTMDAALAQHLRRQPAPRRRSDARRKTQRDPIA